METSTQVETLLDNSAGSHVAKEYEDAQTKQSDSHEEAAGFQFLNHPGIKLRVDWVTDDLEVVHQKETSTYPFDINSILQRDSLPRDRKIFEVVTTYGISRGLRKGPDSSGEISMQDLALRTANKPRVSLHIYSKAIICALRTVVDYYPTQSLHQEPLVISEPYSILIHHRKELAEYKEMCRSRARSELCIRELDVCEHLTLLEEFLEKTIMPSVYAELVRHEERKVTWDMAWLDFRPGNFQTFAFMGELDLLASRVIHSIADGTLNDRGKDWTMFSWTLAHDGHRIGRVMDVSWHVRFDGTDNRDSNWRLGGSLEHFNAEEHEDREKLIQRGRKHFKLLKSGTCQYYRGKTSTFPYSEIEGLVMVDMKAYYSQGDTEPPKFIENVNDMNSWVSDCTCSVCKSRHQNHQYIRKEGGYAKFHMIYVEDHEELDDDMCILLPATIYAYVFKTRSWEKLFIDDFSEPQFDPTMIDKLVMDETRLTMIKSLAASYIRENKHGEKSEQSAWQADFVEGKGKGHIFLLHGKPGVGKTYTAECIASYTKSPLMTLTTSDLGSDPEKIENILTDTFKRAKTWGAILLIDEADVFMERRSTNDLERNRLVAGFLRALEYYDGILFLTTNRIGHFDDAFTSRIHHKFRYPDFDDEDRTKIWKSFMQKLEKERGDHIRLSIDAEEYLETSGDLRKVKWNGREIRNGFQTAVALAEYDAEKDKEGKILLRKKHFASVVKMSLEFQEYMEELHSANEDDRAQRARDR